MDSNITVMVNAEQLANRIITDIGKRLSKKRLSNLKLHCKPNQSHAKAT